MDGETTYRGTYTQPKNIIPPPPPHPEKFYLIWSVEHGQWWKPNSFGYTASRDRAGRYTLDQALTICKVANHCLTNDDPPQECIVPA